MPTTSVTATRGSRVAIHATLGGGVTAASTATADAAAQATAWERLAVVLAAPKQPQSASASTASKRNVVRRKAP